MTDEILKDAELDEVVGGSGVQCMGLAARLKAEGLYAPKSPLIVGNEKAIAQELQGYLNGLGIPDFRAEIHSDYTPNYYGVVATAAAGDGPLHCNTVFSSIDENEVISLIKKHLGVI